MRIYKGYEIDLMLSRSIYTVRKVGGDNKIIWCGMLLRNAKAFVDRKVAA